MPEQAPSMRLNKLIKPPLRQATPGRRPHRVVIVGGGFAGLRAARKLARRPLEVTLVDRRNFHLFQPLEVRSSAGAWVGSSNNLVPGRASIAPAAGAPNVASSSDRSAAGITLRTYFFRP